MCNILYTSGYTRDRDGIRQAVYGHGQIGLAGKDGKGQREENDERMS